MNSSDKEKTLFSILLNRSLDGEATAEDIQQMNTLLSTYPDIQAYYFKLMKIQSAIHEVRIDGELSELANTSSDNQFWASMAEHEKTAPEIMLSQEEPKKELIQKVVYPSREQYRISKLTIFTLVNVAAVILLILFIRVLPPNRGIEVATLTDSLDAKWADLTMPQGTRLKSEGSSLILREGMAELLFDNNTKVVLEAPVEFELVSKDQIYLKYGRLYATVPVEGVGFSVDTSNSRVIDLGTEFGVDADVYGNTYLHVTKGKTVLIAGDKTNKKTVEVAAGGAKKISAYSQNISDISCNERLFVRDINSASNFIWHGETTLDLVDIIGGGNGFGGIRSLVGLDPSTGHYSPIDWQPRSIINDYSLVSDSKYIDGVFVPDGNQDGTIPVTSLGHTFECPDTGGNYTFGIIACAGDLLKQHPTVPPAVFKGQTYDDGPLLMVHSNAGITFDLQAIRQSLPGHHLKNFKALGGLTEAQDNTKGQPPDVDFWILVDGEIRYEKKAFMLEDGLLPFDLQLGPQDRFLTLIITDGSQPDEPRRGYVAYSKDFFYLIDPTLQIVQDGGN